MSRRVTEWLTDEEKRILLSALSREKEVCIQVDKDCEPREHYELTLKSVCESLEHKFYYDRLFNQMEKQIRAEAIDEFADMIKEFVINNGTIPNHTNVELLKIKIKELKEQK